VIRRAVLIVPVLVGLASLAGSTSAQEEDQGLFAVPDTVFEAVSQPGPSYDTVYDRDRSRSNWTQTLGYSRSERRTALSLSGNMTTQDFLSFPNRVTLGGFDGHLDARLTRRWVLSLNGRSDMYSANDGNAQTDTRNNRLQIQTQYMLNPIPSLTVIGAAYSEFQRQHDRTIQSRISTGLDDTDSLIAKRDSSYTTGRQDGLSGTANWNAKPWLLLSASANASRVRPHQRSLVRDFATALDGSGGGTFHETRESTNNPSDNASYTSRLTYSGLRRAKMVFGFLKSEVDQSTFDRQLRGQERLSSNRTSGTYHLDYGPFWGTSLTLDAGLVRSLREYQLRRASNSLVTTRTLGGTLSRATPDFMVGMNATVDRSRYERQATQNGLILERRLTGNGMRRISQRLVLDGLGSISLRRSAYLNPAADQDVSRSLFSLGGGYRVSNACSTTVHFSAARNHTVALDPSSSGSNAVQSNYQMNAALRLGLWKNFAIRQDYLLSADYRILDYVESNNYLNRIRRIDTDFVDTLFTFAFVRLTHNFIFRDQGSYLRRPGEPNRAFRVSVETYEQTLSATVGVALARGIRFSATQSLYNQRNHFLSNDRSTNRNRFSLNAGIDVNRTFASGTQIRGAIRHIGGYDEVDRIADPFADPNEEDYWIAGATVHKDF
jgi:hypothetical protein